MSLLLDGTNGLSDVDGTAATPAIRGTDTNTGIFFPAADTIAFSEGGVESMWVDASGNLGIGTSTPTRRLAVIASAAAVAEGVVVVNTATDGYSAMSLGDANAGVLRNGSTQSAYAGANSLSLYTLGANPIGFVTNNNERMRIDSSGNLGIGTISPTSRVSIVGSGNTSATNALNVVNSSSTSLFSLRSDGYFLTGTATASPYNATSASAANVYVQSDGGLYRSTSSIKYKTSVQDATHGLAEVLALRPVTYKGTSKNDGDKVFGGFIAEEVHEAGLTEFVQYAEDGSPDALAYGNMVSLCIKAIQEQQATIAAMETRLAALEA